MLHVQQKHMIFISINAKMQKVFISLVWFLLNYTQEAAAMKGNDK